MPDLDELRRHLTTLGRVVLGYSGGVDSALLAVAGTQVLGADRLLAVIGRSASLPAEQHGRARAIAARHGITLLEVDTHELSDPRYLANPVNRCYFCKHELWTRLGAVAEERGFETVADGTNADDLREHRPGARAAGELAVRSPLAELGWDKTAVRAAARALDIEIWDAPAAPCLSSRVRYGVAITPERLRQVESGEAFLRTLGVAGDLRVRHHGAAATIEVRLAELDRVRSAWGLVASTFATLGFERVELDPRGYRRGSLLVLDHAQPA